MPSCPTDGAEHYPSPAHGWGRSQRGFRAEEPEQQSPGAGTPAGKGCLVPVQGRAAGPERGGGIHVSLTSRRCRSGRGPAAPGAAAPPPRPLHSPGTGASGKWWLRVGWLPGDPRGHRASSQRSSSTPSACTPDLRSQRPTSQFPRAPSLAPPHLSGDGALSCADWGRMGRGRAPALGPPAPFHTWGAWRSLVSGSNLPGALSGGCMSVTHSPGHPRPSSGCVSPESRGV